MNITRTMPLRMKVVLKSRLSEETMDALRTYLGEFAYGRYTIEHFDGTVAIYLRDQADVELIRGNFRSLITHVQPLY